MINTPLSLVSGFWFLFPFPYNVRVSLVSKLGRVNLGSITRSA